MLKILVLMVAMQTTTPANLTFDDVFQASGASYTRSTTPSFTNRLIDALEDLNTVPTAAAKLQSLGVTFNPAVPAVPPVSVTTDAGNVNFADVASKGKITLELGKDECWDHILGIFARLVQMNDSAVDAKLVKHKITLDTGAGLTIDGFIVVPAGVKFPR